MLLTCTDLITLIHGCTMATGAQSTPLQQFPPQGTLNQTIKSITTVYSLPASALKMQTERMREGENERMREREMGSML